MDLSGAVLLSKPDTLERHAREQLSQLIRVGGKLAVLGVEDGPRAMGKWHIAVPGTWSMPQGNSGQGDQQGDDLTYAKALCGRRIVTNGYASDWRPPAGLMCPGCHERL